MRYTGLQPQYFPRLHYFARIFATDIFVVRDDAQFVSKHKYPDGRTDKSYQAHTPIKQAFGRQLLPVSIKHEGFQPIAKTQVSYTEKWPEKHLKYLKVGYNKAPNFGNLFPQLKAILNYRFISLSDLNIATLAWGLGILLSKKWHYVTQLNIDTVNIWLKENRKQQRLKQIKSAIKFAIVNRNWINTSANEKILALIKEVGADEDYCGGTAYSSYLENNLFLKAGIKVTVQDWKCPQYPQLYHEKLGFISDLSIIDILMNIKPEKAWAYLTESKK